MRIAKLQLKAKEGAVHKGTEDIGAEIWSGQSPLGGIDQIESVKISHKSQDRDDPDAGQDQWQLNLEKSGEAGDPFNLGSLENLIGNRQKGGPAVDSRV